MSFIISGVNGFIGSALSKELLKREIKFLGIDLHSKLSLDYPYKCLVHLAAKTFIPDAWENPSSFINVNLDLTLKSLEIARTHNLKYIYISAYIYGNQGREPISENALPNPNNPYAFSKYLSEQAVQFYQNTYSLNATILRPFNVYGPDQNKKFLIPSLIKQAIISNTITLNFGSTYRDYIYIDDFVDAIISSENSCNGFNIYNVGSGKSYNVEEIVEVITKCLKKPLNIKKSAEDRINEIPYVLADISKISKDIGWKPTTSLNKGIKQMINHERIR